MRSELYKLELEAACLRCPPHLLVLFSPSYTVEEISQAGSDGPSSQQRNAGHKGTNGDRPIALLSVNRMATAEHAFFLT